MHHRLTPHACTKHRRRSRRHPDVVNELIRRRQPALARVAARAAPSPTARAVAARAAPSRSLRPESHAGVVQCSSARSRGVGGRERQWVADLDSRARAYLGAATEHLEHMATAAASTRDLSRYQHGCCLSTDRCIAPAATTSRKVHRGLVKNRHLRTLSAEGSRGQLAGGRSPDSRRRTCCRRGSAARPQLTRWASCTRAPRAANRLMRARRMTQPAGRG